MNLIEAKKILELSDSWNEEDIKKNYKRLAMKYHPDKCKEPGNDFFVKINEAYQFIEKFQNDPSPVPFIHIIDLTKIFGNNCFQSRPRQEFINIKIEITIKEYFTGTSKTIKQTCLKCSGCGFETPDSDIQFCLLCKGDGSINHGQLQIQKCTDLTKNIQLNNLCISICLNDKKYSYLNNKIYYNFNISLKESLVGFKKIFTDPFGEVHKINITHVPVKQNDGYLISTLDVNIVILFNIIYPKNNYSQEIIDLLKRITF